MVRLEGAERGLADVAPACGAVDGKQNDLAHRRDNRTCRNRSQFRVARDVPVIGQKPEVWLTRRKADRRDPQVRSRQFFDCCVLGQPSQTSCFGQLRAVGSAVHGRDGDQAAAYWHLGCEPVLRL